LRQALLVLRSLRARPLPGHYGAAPESRRHSLYW